MAFLLLVPLLLALVVYAVSGFVLLLWRQHHSPLRLLRGPSSPSFFMGNLMQMHDQENNNLLADWESTYGSTFVYRGFIGGCRLMLTDPIAVAHVLGHAYDYPKPDFVRDSLASMAAGHDGLLTSEGEMHRKQRKILTPAFSASHIKSLTPIFWEKAEQLRDIWLSISVSSPHGAHGPHGEGKSKVDALQWLTRATLDVIGLAGFGYTFNSLSNAAARIERERERASALPPNTDSNGECQRQWETCLGQQDDEEENELANAFSVIFSTARKFRVMTILQVWFPFLRRFRRNNATMNQAQNTMRRIGMELINERKETVMKELEQFKESLGSDKVVTGDKTTIGRDILSVLIRSNLSASPNQRMSTNETLCQISTFLAAGHETTGSALTWCLYALVQNPRAQQRLREALREVALEVEGAEDGGDTATQKQQRLTDAVSRCEYLDWVVRESLRVHAPVTNTMRVCMRAEDEIPVSRGGLNGEEGGYLDKNGVRRYTIRVKKWDIISVPIQAINKSIRVWGEDAGVFRPERWANPPSRSKAVPGLYSNTLTFLNGNPLDGNRACIGYKFALLEIKVFLYVLLKDIEFSMEPSMVIEKKVNVVTRPFVKSEPHLGNQMPLYVRHAPPTATNNTGSDSLANGISLPAVSASFPTARTSPSLPSTLSTPPSISRRINTVHPPPRSPVLVSV